jgi:hypothetical protein
MLPTPGSRWFTETSGGTFTVGDVDIRRGVLLLGDLGQPPVRVAIYGWPGPWKLIPGESQEADGHIEYHRLRTMLLGGAEGRHLVRVRDILSEMGFELANHVPGYGPPNLPKIPSDIEIVVALVSHLGHPLYQDAKARCKASGLPMALAESGGLREDLRKERIRLGLRPWTKMGGIRYGSEDEAGWWTWHGGSWVWTTERTAQVDTPSALEEQAMAPASSSIQADPVDTLGSLGLLAVGLAALFGS